MKLISDSARRKDENEIKTLGCKLVPTPNYWKKMPFAFKPFSIFHSTAEKIFKKQFSDISHRAHS